jgi:hypothetical protein
VIRRVGQWALAASVLRRTARGLERAIEGTLREEAHDLRNEITRGLTAQAPGGHALAKPSPVTLASRKLEGVGGRRALLATMEMRRAITAVVRGLTAFVGIADDARGSDGRRLAKIAQLQEFGHAPFTVRITPAMRRFFGVLRRRARGRAPERGSGGGGTIVVRIPARPFLRPAFERFARGSQHRFLRRMRRRLGSP